MNKEVAAGGVVFRREGDKILFLLIYSGRNRFWGFPKGHLEPGEREEQAAVREIEEETGLKEVRRIGRFREEDVYPALSNQGPFRGQRIEKHSVYFLFETGEKQIRVDEGEITDYRWLEFGEAMSLLSFESGRDLLRKADNIIRGK